MIDWTKPLCTKMTRTRAERIGALPEGMETKNGRSVAVAVHFRDGICILNYTREGVFDPSDPTGDDCLDLINVEPAENPKGVEAVLVSAVAAVALVEIDSGQIEQAKASVQAIIDTLKPAVDAYLASEPARQEAA
jgi:hypothetical protein